MPTKKPDPSAPPFASPSSLYHAVDDPSPRRFHYDAFVTTVHDGDTLTLDIDLGHGVWLRDQALRLHGLNAPEVTGAQKAEGIKSRNALRERIADGGWTEGIAHHVVIETFKDKDDKYGRKLARVYVLSTTPGGTAWKCVNDELVRFGFARAWDGQGSKPV